MLITGGAGGLARGLVREFKAGGYEVLAPGHQELDVCNGRRLREYICHLERLDLLINNAAITRDSLLVKSLDGDLDAVLDTNLRGAFLCACAAAEVMQSRQQGHIVMLGSYSGIHGNAGQTAYAAAKSALAGLTGSLAREFAAANIRVNCVLPGFMTTPMTDRLSETGRQAITDAHLLNCMSTPADVARFILCLQQMPAVSGQVFNLDSRPRKWT